MVKNKSASHAKSTTSTNKILRNHSVKNSKKKILEKISKNKEDKDKIIVNDKYHVDDKNQKIKLYGILDVDKHLYIKIQFASFILLTGVFIWGWLNEISQTILIIIIIAFILETGETYFALTKWSKNQSTK